MVCYTAIKYPLRIVKKKENGIIFSQKRKMNPTFYDSGASAISNPSKASVI